MRLSQEDKVGVLLYGVREKQNPNNVDGIRLLLERPGCVINYTKSSGLPMTKRSFGFRRCFAVKAGCRWVHPFIPSVFSCSAELVLYTLERPIQSMLFVRTLTAPAQLWLHVRTCVTGCSDLRLKEC